MPDQTAATLAASELRQAYAAAITRAEKAEAIVTRVTNRMNDYIQHGSGMVSVRQVLNLLSPTWPDGNYSNEDPS